MVIYDTNEAAFMYVSYTIALLADVLFCKLRLLPAERTNDKVAMCVTRTAPKYLR